MVLLIAVVAYLLFLKMESDYTRKGDALIREWMSKRGLKLANSRILVYVNTSRIRARAVALGPDGKHRRYVFRLGGQLKGTFLSEPELLATEDVSEDDPVGPPVIAGGLFLDE
jgi:hypothetical protein